MFYLMSGCAGIRKSTNVQPLPVVIQFNSNHV